MFVLSIGSHMLPITFVFLLKNKRRIICSPFPVERKVDPALMAAEVGQIGQNSAPAFSQVPSPSSAVHVFANAKLEFIWVLLIAQAFKPGYGWTIRLGL
jgi:hypothetical protein